MMERYAAYKDSGIEWIGKIPEGWGAGRISGLYEQRNEKVSDQDYPPLSVTMQGIVPQLETAAKTQDGDNRKLVRTDDFAINSRSDRRGSCGISSMDGSVSLITNVLKPIDHQSMNNRYYEYLYKSEGFSDEYYRWGTGIADDLWSTNWSRMKNILVPIPSKAEQLIIAGFLDTRTAEIDSLIADQEKSIELLQEYRKAVISEAVTKGLDPDVPMKDSGIEWIGEIPEGWSVVKQSMLGQSVLGKMLDEKTSKVGEMRPYLSNRDVQWLSINTTNLKKMGFPLGDNERYTLRNGDVLICEGGEIGRCAVWDKGDTNISFQKAVHRFRPNRNVLNSYYFAYEMFQKAEVSTFVEVRKGESTIAHLPGDQLGRLQILVPPLSEQSDIAMFLDHKTAETDSLISDKQQLIDKLKEYRKSLISEAVTGKFKVPGVA